MDRRFLTVLGVSLVFALVVTTVFYQMTARSSTGSSTPKSEDMPIVLATRPLGVGVMIRPADVKLGKISAAAFPKGAFSKVEEVLDRPVISNVLLDEAILDGRLAQKGSGLGLAPTIPVGMRAVTIRVNDVGGVAGFVLPGMRVDVLVTGRPPTGEEANTMTNTVLQNMQVLSAGQRMEADAGGKPMTTPTVTLLANPDEAEILTLSNNEGRIQLVLRNSSDQEIANTSGSFVGELYGAAKRHRGVVEKPAAAAPVVAAPRPRPRPAPVAVAVAPPPPAPPPPPAAPPEVVIIRGTQRSVEVVARPISR